MSISVYTDKSLDELIKQQTIESADRDHKQEDIYIDNIPAILVTTTSKFDSNWITKTVYLAANTSVYAIGNGAVEMPEFDLFYNSFRLQ